MKRKWIALVLSVSVLAGTEAVPAFASDILESEGNQQQANDKFNRVDIIRLQRRIPWRRTVFWLD